MTIKGGTSQACAVCKYQRRKCSLDCPLAPYFPADKPKMFQNVHRLYGVCNVMKILRQLSGDQKEEAMRSIIYESNMRRRYPVYGCSLVIWQLKEQIRHAQEELYWVNSWLAVLRNKDLPSHGQVVSDLTHQFQLGMGFASNNDNNNYYESNVDQQACLLGSYQFFEGGKDIGYVEASDVKPNMWVQQQQGNNNGYYVNNNLSSMNNNDSVEMKTYMMQQELVPFQQQAIEGYYDDDVPLDTIADDRQSYSVESKIAYESSAESRLDSKSQNHELISAATCFSLTNVA